MARAWIESGPYSLLTQHTESHVKHAPTSDNERSAAPIQDTLRNDSTQSNTHTLDTPLVRGKQTLDAITLRKPTVGELRGASLSDLINLDVAALQKVLPRISSPTLTEHDVANLDPADLIMLGGIFASFLMPKAVKSKLDSPSA
ncbi:Phage protein [Mycetohabitans rhizoxinica HKI 454]|uniref:Phage protein n=1 Tax=Mycetohabitans rhizoxinica (strain DSM 19002 / CIP 109453 / HKI 454) TaxID=882378 RepID=E5AKN9_MYCRK|nr:Phage protein [Mycetohabitans rhizoxinica HKI 454]